MSRALYPIAGLRFWSEKEIQQREQAIGRLKGCVERTLLDLNQSWRLERVEAPVIMPLAGFSDAYDADDVFSLRREMNAETWALRAETTPGSYLYAQHLLQATGVKPPLCVWQAGLSFRTEAADGATAAKLRFNAFYQLEFQCIYRADSHADYATALREALEEEIAAIINERTRLVPSDRLPSYATETIDIEGVWRGGGQSEWKEVASTSRRTDFPVFDPYLGTTPKNSLTVFEVAIGLDRVIALSNQEA
ncbi:aminoacyl-tRNA synthetase [Brevundimonas phage vB_BpoS-Papperlapapp]|uniref:Aminoacyl-tRNA synthetase n=2 Tax=Marchewkavirus TaxID=3425052 RepID=A0A9E7MQ51_9CAUD|nr:aminoacyl-tRNA synthetase [Brevundimonas phage vB_BpoS-Kabachok]USN14785.1 aminoacyl-tRNA synthetase [Brevundimonas phage vB_BpoS-Domovoi]USN16157.1 aminoacyl-tRNA synthetase [Brevundimonas phage vB_BpoS-Papperlapapp]